MNYESIINFISAYPSTILLLAIATVITIRLLVSQYTDKCANLLVKIFDPASSHLEPLPKFKESLSSAKAIILSLKWFTSYVLVKLLPDHYSIVLKNRWIQSILANFPGYQTVQEKISRIEDELTDKLADSLMFSQSTEETPPELERTYLKKLELYRLHHALENVAMRFTQIRSKENLYQYQTIFLRYQTLYDEILHQTNTDPNAREWQKYRDTLEYHRRYLNSGF